MKDGGKIRNFASNHFTLCLSLSLCPSISQMTESIQFVFGIRHQLTVHINFVSLVKFRYAVHGMPNSLNWCCIRKEISSISMERMNGNTNQRFGILSRGCFAFNQTNLSILDLFSTAVDLDTHRTKKM